MNEKNSIKENRRKEYFEFSFFDKIFLKAGGENQIEIRKTVINTLLLFIIPTLILAIGFLLLLTNKEIFEKVFSTL